VTAFRDVLGHEGARAILERALAQKRLPPALLLVGTDGIGKRTLALAVGRALLCETGEGCGSCTHCRRIDASLLALPGRREHARGARDDAAFNHLLHPDMLLVEASSTTKEGKERAKSEIKVEQVRALVQQSFGRPFEAAARFFLIDDAHAMNPSSANSLLKSLEEPPPTTHFALVSSAPQALLPTIRSRCQILRLQPLPLAILERHLREQRGLAADEARLRATLADGSLGRALALESAVYRDLRDRALELLESDGSALARLEQAQSLTEAEDQLPLLLLALRSLLRDVAALRAGLEPRRLLNLDVAERLAPLAKSPLGLTAGALAERVAESVLAVQGNVTKLLEMDMLADAEELRRA
jgi:DNA polymerase-3 subunit delta'